MSPRTLLLCALCLSLALTACTRRLPTSQPAPPTAAATGEANPAGNDPAGDQLENELQQLDEAQATAEPEIEALSTPEPPTTPPAASTGEPLLEENDPLGDQLETLLQQLDDANATAEPEMEELANP